MIGHSRSVEMAYCRCVSIVRHANECFYSNKLGSHENCRDFQSIMHISILMGISFPRGIE